MAQGVFKRSQTVSMAVIFQIFQSFVNQIHDTFCPDFFAFFFLLFLIFNGNRLNDIWPQFGIPKNKQKIEKKNLKKCKKKLPWRISLTVLFNHSLVTLGRVSQMGRGRIFQVHHVSGCTGSWSSCWNGSMRKIGSPSIGTSANTNTLRYLKAHKDSLYF